MRDNTETTVNGEPNADAIAKRAYELFLQRGSVPGFELDDWLQAEAELVSVASIKKNPSASGRNTRNSHAR